MTSGSVLLDATHISKHFGGVQALDDVSVEIRAGEIHGLVGANGAGKSTLIAVLSGAVEPDSGSVSINGAPIPTGDLAAARRAGIAVVHQELMLFPDLTVAENISASRLPRHGLGIIDRRTGRRRVEKALDALRVKLPLDRRVRDLPLAQRQLVEISRALNGGGTLLILDEPTSALSRPETVGLFATLRGLAAEGMSVVFVSHKLDEILELTDRITVLRDGRVNGHWRTADADIRSITHAMVGELADARRSEPRSPGATVLSLRSVAAKGVQPLDLDLHAGEVVGLCGLEGSGSAEALEMIAGVIAADGPIRVGGEEVRLRHPADAIRKGIVYLPPDRKRDGLWLERSPLWNIATADVGFIGGLRILPSRQLRDKANLRLDAVGVRAADRNEFVGRFSGGNQQRVMLARCLEMKPRILLLADFTRGVDVRAKAAIHDIVRKLAAAGMSICLTSSDLDELLDVCDRLVFMRAGRKIAEGPAPDFDRMDVLSLVTTGRAATPAPGEALPPETP